MPCDFASLLRPLLGPWQAEASYSEARACRKGCLFSIFQCVVLLTLFPGNGSGAGGVAAEKLSKQPGAMTEREGTVTFYRQPDAVVRLASVPQALNFGSSLMTSNLSRAVVLLLNGSFLRLREVTRLEIARRPDATDFPKIVVSGGTVYAGNRGIGMRAIAFQTTGQVGGVAKGTEFLIEVDPQTRRTVVTVFDGQVTLTNELGSVQATSGLQAVAETGIGPTTKAIRTQNIVQWWIYYPAVLDPDELGLTQAQRLELSESLTAYQQGDLQAALKKYPGYPNPPDSAHEARRIYLAGLLLSVGAVDAAETHLSDVSSNAPLARALRIMIKAVTPPRGEEAQRQNEGQRERTGKAGETIPPVAPASTAPEALTASEWLALSYEYQSQRRLKDALEAAKAAATKSPRFGFGWARVAELEFSFGRIRAARRAIDRALDVAPQNAQALAVNGFLLAADNRTKAAIEAFDQAIKMDPALANAWLGRGLCKRRLGWFQSNPDRSATNAGPSWLSDLQTAASLEPDRSLLRSCLGKAFSEIDDSGLALKELDRAAEIDANDPTPWLYLALEKSKDNRVNEAVDDLEHSIELNDNRAVYRSRSLLDEDRAVRSSSLARIYQDAGMNEVSFSEATRAVSYDYGNYSAHLFLSESYDALRDPARFNLRYETPWFSEWLMANLLSPVGGTPLSQHISLQEYSRLFERNRLGLVSQTEYRSDGQIREVASQYGRYDNSAYALDLDYQHNTGVRPNNELDRLEFYGTFKQQITPQDSLLLLTEIQNYHAGDNYQVLRSVPSQPHLLLERLSDAGRPHGRLPPGMGAGRAYALAWRTSRR